MLKRILMRMPMKGGGKTLMNRSVFLQIVSAQDHYLIIL